MLNIKTLLSLVPQVPKKIEKSFPCNPIKDKMAKLHKVKSSIGKLCQK